MSREKSEILALISLAAFVLVLVFYAGLASNSAPVCLRCEIQATTPTGGR